MSGLMRHERATELAHVPGKAQRQTFISTSPQRFGLERLADLGVAAALVEVKLGAGPAVVYLDEVEAPLLEIKARILALVTVKACPEAVRVVVIA